MNNNVIVAPPDMKVEALNVGLEKKNPEPEIDSKVLKERVITLELGIVKVLNRLKGQGVVAYTDKEAEHLANIMGTSFKPTVTRKAEGKKKEND